MIIIRRFKKNLFCIFFSESVIIKCKKKCFPLWVLLFYTYSFIFMDYDDGAYE